MSTWILVAAVLQGGVWHAGAEKDVPDSAFETKTACEVFMAKQQREVKGDFIRFECVTGSERHSLLPLHRPGSSILEAPG